MDLANILPTTLLLLYFIAPATKGLKDETKVVWTLQSTVQIQFKSPEACRRIGMQLIDDIEPVVTMTVRAYCLCEDGNEQEQQHLTGPLAGTRVAGGQCPKWTVKSLQSTVQSARELQPGTIPSIEPLGPTPKPKRR